MSILFAAVPAFAAGTALYIDTENIYADMVRSYQDGYVPTVSGGNASIVLPLKSMVALSSITVTPNIGTGADIPFSYGNYEFNVLPDQNGIFVVQLSLPLKQDRVNGVYPVTFQVRYTENATLQTQEFPIYVTIADGRDPNWTEPETPEAPEQTPAVTSQLTIDSTTRYEGMASTYAQGYMPAMANGAATIILPLKGVTYNGEVTVSADLGATTDSPFVFGNYQQTAYGRGLYVFRFDIPLASSRINGSYPVILKANYLDANGAQQEQSFTVYVTISDGKKPADMNAVAGPQKVDQPELYISRCEIEPRIVGGDEEFTITATIGNIGSRQARNIKVSVSNEAMTILPVDTMQSQLISRMDSGKEQNLTFQMKTTKEILAGNHTVFINFSYIDAYGGSYSASSPFVIAVEQPAAISYDPIALPKEITAGETVTLPANVFNVGKSTLRNVTVNLIGAGLFPTSSVFLGDILPGEAGYGEMKVFIGMLSMTEGYSESYGKTNGVYTISYQDDAGETYTIDLACSTEIKKPVIEGEDDEEEQPDPASQWWISMILGLGVIAIIICVIVVNKFMRAMKMREGM